MGTENWKPLPGYEEFYEVSDEGRIRSTGTTRFRKNGVPYTHRSKILKPSTSEKGYKRVILYKPEASPKTMTLHRAVLLAFRPGPAEGAIIRHLDGDPGNNDLRNLAWGSPAENSADMEAHGRNHYRNRTHCPHGHELVNPNLVRGKLEKGQRSCRTCHQARSDQFQGSLLTMEQSLALRHIMVFSRRAFRVKTRKKWEARWLQAGCPIEMIYELPEDVDD